MIQRPHWLRLPPAAYLLPILAVALLLSAWVLHLTTQQSWLGLRFSMDAESTPGLSIVSVDKKGPAYGRLQAGQRIIAIEGKHDTVALTTDLLRAPDWFATYAQFNDFLITQDRISNILREPSVRFRLETGESVVVTPTQQRPLLALPALHWLYLAAGLLGFGVGVIVWFYRPAFLPALMLLVGGIGAMLYYASVVTIERELALPSTRLSNSSIAGALGVHAFIWAEVAIFHIYPRKLLGGVYALIPSFIITMAFPLNSALQLVELPIHAYDVQYIIVMAWFYPLFYYQWRASRKQALERAFLKLAVLAMVVPSTVVILLFLAPLIASTSPQMPHEYARLVLAPMILGWAIGLMRYRLFDVELWWFKSVVWIVGGLMVVLIDILLIVVVNLQARTALGIGLVIAGFIYFPMRQWMIGRIIPGRERPLHEELPKLARLFASAATEGDFERRWESELINRFKPVDMKQQAKPFQEPAFEDYGLTLKAPSLGGDKYYELSGKNGGDRLFRPQDVTTINALLTIVRLVRNSSEERSRAAEAERKRIMMDLHDTLGAKLLSLTHRTTGAAATEAREALQILRETVRLSTQSRPMELSALIADLRAETCQRAEAAGVKLHWPPWLAHQERYIDPVHALALSNMLRETVTNALKHANPKHLYIDIEGGGKLLQITVRNDGAISNPTDWSPGFGLSNIRSRLETLGGELEMGMDDGQEPGKRGIVSIRITLPIRHSKNDRH